MGIVIKDFVGSWLSSLSGERCRRKYFYINEFQTLKYQHNVEKGSRKFANAA
jgi:hypothetical protein